MRIKLTMFFLIFAWMQGTAKIHAQKVSLNQQNTPLEKVFLQIEKQTGYVFVYDSEQLRTKTISIRVKNVSLEEAVSECLKELPFSFKILDKNILIRSEKPIPPVNTPVEETPFKEIKGQVKDENGKPLAGASVKIKGTNKAVVTDQSGTFTIDAEKGQTLEISFVGYQTAELVVGDANELTVSLALSFSNMDEAVVIGYGVQKRAHLTSAVGIITEKDIKNRVVSTAAGALKGADPSVNLTFNSGTLDSDYKIDIRGVASVNGGTPLIMADGIEVNLNQINPNDIESVTVLKDASASAIYGAKASSGVIIITTKKGKNMEGKAKVNLTSRFGVSQNTTSTDFIRIGYDHVNIVNQFYEIYQGTQMALYSGDDLQMLLDRRNDLTEHPDRPWTIVKPDNRYYYYGNFDWYNYFYRNSRPQMEQNLSVTGGNNNVNYYISGRLWSQDGIFKIFHDNYKNYSFRAKVDAKIKPWLKYTGTANFNSSNYIYAGYENEQQTIHALQSNILASFVPRNPDGTIMQYPNQLNANSPIGAGHGGYLTANEARNKRGNKYLILSNQFDVSLTKDLELTASYAYKTRNRLYTYRGMPFEYSRAAGTVLTFTSGTIYNYYQESHFNVNNHNLNVYATYRKNWGGGHHFTFLAGGQYEDYRQTNLSVEKKDLLSNSLSSFSIANGEAVISQSIGAFRTLGYFSRVNYDYKGKYMFEASGRFDGTSRFAPEQRWGFFPAASVGWRMSEENFWEPLRGVINNSKLRLSMGSLGNQQVSYYSYIDQISTTNTMSYTFDGSTTAYYASVSNPITPDLTWETVTTYNAGLDLALLKNRLTVTTDVYIRETKDMLTPSLTLPSVYGAATPTANAADLRTKGWELYVGWNDKFLLRNKPFDYNIGFTLGDYKTVITKYNNPDKLISDYYEGMRLGEIWGYKVKGLFASDEDAAAYQAAINDKAVNNRVYSSKKDNYLRAGDVEFIDLDHNGIINEGAGTVSNPGDMTIIGNSLPRYSYSIRLGASWNGIDVAVFLQGVGKQHWFPHSLAYDFWGPYSFPSLSFIHRDFMQNVWSEENPNAYFPRPRGYASYSAGALYVPTDRYLQNVAYLRLKNISIGYTLPISKRLFDQVRIYASGENLFYWSKLKKYTKTVDPELTNTTATYNSGSGVGYTYSKIYTVGIDIQF
jgi:TonB-linked SusC/RagA family outer membrane protein